MDTPRRDDPGTLNEEAREALVMLQQYLSDQVPPMLFADSFEHLLGLPPSLVGEEIQAWVAAQYRRASSLPVSDYLFHAAKKIHMLKELQLVPREQIESFLSSLAVVLAELCPPEDRPHLQDDLARLDEAKTVLAAAVDVVHQRATGGSGDAEPGAPPLRSTLAAGAPAPVAAAAASAAPLSPGAARGLRRFELLLQRLAGENLPASSVPPAAVLAEAVAEAVGGAVSHDDLLARLASLEKLGSGASPQRLLRVLGSRLPDWAPPPGASTDAPPPGSVGVLRKALDLSEDRLEAARRFEELVHAAAEEFNTGALGRAVTMLELAQSMLANKRLAPETARALQSKGHTLLAPAQLRAFAEDPDKAALLRRALAFFADLAPAELLAQLEREESRERRRHLLTVLIAHGEESRRLALNTLREAAAGATVIPWQFARNLLYLLRRVPPPADHRLDDEVEVLAPLSQPGGPLAVVREALAALGQIRSPRAEATLIARVAELEEAALGIRPLPYETVDVLGLLDRTVGALARSSSPAARRCAVSHALRRKPQLGNTLARAAELGEQDLAGDSELVDRIVTAIREELPKRVLGVTLASARKSDTVEGLIALLAGTTSQAVREFLASIVERFPGQAFADAAARALERVARPARSQPAPPNIAGDLALFGLPSLLQNLAESRLTGLLTLFGDGGSPAGTIRLLDGLVTAATAGPLTAKPAVYQLLALPLTRFVFTQEEAPAGEVGEDGPLAVLPLVMEGMRRVDEYRRACALLPDEVRLRPTGQRPTRPTDEHDVAFMRDLWARVIAGASPGRCEREIGAESYRVRRLLTHWLVEGALELADAPAPA